jgi:hypothetical protein
VTIFATAVRVVLIFGKQYPVFFFVYFSADFSRLNSNIFVLPFKQNERRLERRHGGATVQLERANGHAQQRLGWGREYAAQVATWI